MSELDHDKDFEAYLARRSGLGASPGPAEALEPPAELDRIVLANAREAIRIDRSRPLFRPVRWALPVGLAATVVLSFTVLLHFGLLPRGKQIEEAPMEAQLQADSAQLTLPTPPAEIAANPPPAVMNDMSADRAELAKVAPSGRIASQSEARAANANAAMRADAAQESPAPAAAPQVTEEYEAAVASSKASAPVELKRESPETPAAWLKRIEALRAQGRTRDAEREWQAFRKAWPDYPVPSPP